MFLDLVIDLISEVYRQSSDQSEISDAQNLPPGYHHVLLVLVKIKSSNFSHFFGPSLLLLNLKNSSQGEFKKWFDTQ